MPNGTPMGRDMHGSLSRDPLPKAGSMVSGQPFGIQSGVGGRNRIAKSSFYKHKEGAAAGKSN